jgi:hypothetical protein
MKGELYTNEEEFCGSNDSKHDQFLDLHTKDNKRYERS